MSRFYGWPHSAIMEMSPRECLAYARQIERIQAQEDLRSSTTASVPHMKKDSRDQYVRSLQRSARLQPKKIKVEAGEISGFLKGLSRENR